MARKLIVEIVGDSKSLERAFRRSEGAAKDFNSTMTRAGRRGGSIFGGFLGPLKLVTGALGVAGLGGAVRAAFTEMADAQKVAAQTQAVIESTGGAAGVSAEHVDKLATSLMQLSGVDDEVIKSGENMLLTFRNVRNRAGKNNKIFDRATKVVLDMSVALGEEAPDSALRLGKALNDPIRGITALRRVGVSFTAAQEDQIESLVKSGKTMEAQKMILRELNTEFGGSAKAAGETLPGKFNVLRETLLNLGGTLAEEFSPAIKRVVDRFTGWITKSENQERILGLVRDAVDKVRGVLKTLHGWLDKVNDITGGAKNSLKLLLGVLVAMKGVKTATTLANIVTQITAIGTNAGLANTKAGGLLTTLRLLGKIGVVAIAFDLIIHENEVDKWLREHHLGFLTARPFAPSGPQNAPVPSSGPQGFGPGGPRPGRFKPAPAPRPQPSFTGPGGGARSVAVFNGPVTVVADDPDQLMRQIERRRRHGAVSRTGPRAGQRG